METCLAAGISQYYLDREEVEEGSTGQWKSQCQAEGARYVEDVEKEDKQNRWSKKRKIRIRGVISLELLLS